MKKISIIIPIYNAGLFLHKCLESIQNQTFTDYEVWLIDDGSTDQSGAICDLFATKDNRFHVLHKQNNGVSSARNTGLKYAQGEWICFIDADDSVNENYLSTLVQHIGTQNDILIIQGYNTILPNNKCLFKDFSNRLYESTDIHLAFKDLNINRCGFPFAKLYNADIIRQHHIRFIESIHYAEDVMFMLTYLCHCSAIQTIEGRNYNYYIRNNIPSLSQRIFSFESEYTCYQTYLARMDELKNKFDMPHESLIKVYNVISEYLVRRSFGGMYQKQTRKPKKERIAILKSITSGQIIFLNSYYKQCSWFYKIIVLLLNRKYYYLCDLFYDLIVTGRSIKTRRKAK